METFSSYDLISKFYVNKVIQQWSIYVSPLTDHEALATLNVRERDRQKTRIEDEMISRYLS